MRRAQPRPKVGQVESDVMDAEYESVDDPK